jgi:hypothetical protein
MLPFRGVPKNRKSDICGVDIEVMIVVEWLRLQVVDAGGCGSNRC